MRLSLLPWLIALAGCPAGAPAKAVQPPVPTVGATWEAFTLEFLQHQECRGKQMYEQFLPEAGKGLTCPLAK